MSCHIPARMSPACLVGIITAPTVREYPNAITSTGKIRDVPSPTGILTAGNHRSHCAISPGSYSVRSTGSVPKYSGRIARNRSFNVVAEYGHPIRCAITVDGIRGQSANRARIAGSYDDTNN